LGLDFNENDNTFVRYIRIVDEIDDKGKWKQRTDVKVVIIRRVTNPQKSMGFVAKWNEKKNVDMKKRWGW
jgi:hypothetical protein